MRILIAAHGFPPTHSAGAERRAERMARWLCANGHYVEVLAVESLNTPGFRIETSQQDNYNIHRLYYDVHDGDQFRNMYDYAPIGDAVRSLLAQQSFDLVHVISGYLLGGQIIHPAHEAGLPVIITLTEYWFLCTRLNLIQPDGVVCVGPKSDEKCSLCLLEDKRRYRLPAQRTPHLMNAFWQTIGHHLPEASHMTAAITQRRTTLYAALNAADLVICPSRYLMSRFAEYGFDTQSYVFMRQGLNLPPETVHTSDAANTLRLTYLGQIQRHKGVDLLIDAVIRLLQQSYPVTLDLWGDATQSPDYVADLQERAANYQAIRWNGHYTGSKVWDILSATDALVIPSRWHENSPNVILEAYAMGVPVVGTNLGGMAELIEHEKSGLLFELNNVDSLAHQLVRLIEDKHLLPRLRTGIPQVRSINEEMQEVVECYHKVLNERMDF